MGTVVSPLLAAAGAAWDDGPGAGGWIAHRLGPFGPTVGHAVPLGYEGYAVAPIAFRDDPDREPRPLSVLESLLEALEPFTGAQPVHVGMWDGFGWWYDHGDDPRTAPGMAVGVSWGEDGTPPSPEEIERVRAEGRERMARERVERPDAEPLRLPHREYYMWTGPLPSVTAFRDPLYDPPSLIWPQDRSWFVGVPIYTFDIAVAGTADVIDAVLADERLDARRATTDDVLEGDD